MELSSQGIQAGISVGTLKQYFSEVENFTSLWKRDQVLCKMRKLVYHFKSQNLIETHSCYRGTRGISFYNVHAILQEDITIIDFNTLFESRLTLLDFTLDFLSQ